MVYTIVQLSRQHKYSVQARSQDIEKWRIITSITTKRKEDMKGRKSRHKEQDFNGPRKDKKKKNQCCMKPSSVVKPSLSLSDSILMIGKSGLPGRILKLILDEKPVVPSSYNRLAASYSIFSCSACAKNG